MTEAHVRVGKRVDGQALHIDVGKLVHMLLAASSGFGKTTALLRIIEELHRLDVQVVILDLEGDFVELRAIGDFVLVGPDGDAPVDVQSARLLARLAREHRFNLIVDLSDETPTTQREWTAAFAEGLGHLPRSLWGTMVVVVDEADKLAPQKLRKGVPVVSGEALVELASRGRKRGIKVLFATQRLAKLDMDIRGECADKLIGHFNAHADAKTAVEELAAQGDAEIRDAVVRLDPGAFYAFGRGQGVDNAVLVHVHQPKTEPPAKGEASKPAPPPRGKVKKLLDDVLKDLPERAATEAATLEEAQREIARLERRVKDLAKGKPDPEASARAGADLREARAALQAAERRVRELERDQERAVAAATREKAKTIAQLVKAGKKHEETWSAWRDRVQTTLGLQVREVESTLSDLLAKAPPPLDGAFGDAIVDAVATPATPPTTSSSTRTSTTRPAQRARARDDADADGRLSSSQQRLLDTLASLAHREERPSKEMLAAAAGVPSTSGGYRNNLSTLRTRGLIEYPSPGTVALTDDGHQVANDDGPAVTTDEIMERAGAVLSASELRILTVLVDLHPESVGKEDLAELCEVPATSGGYRNNLSHMRTLGYIEYPEAGRARAADWLKLGGVG